MTNSEVISTLLFSSGWFRQPSHSVSIACICLLLLLHNSSSAEDCFPNKAAAIAGCKRFCAYPISYSIECPDFNLVFNSTDSDVATLSCTTITNKTIPRQTPVIHLGNIKNLAIKDCDATIAERIDANTTEKLELLSAVGDTQRRLSSLFLSAGTAELHQLGIYGSDDVDTLEPGALDHMTRVSEIVLRNNEFRSLPFALLAKIVNLRSFMLWNRHGFKMPTLPPRFFENLTKLSHIHLTCGLQQLPGDLFVGSVNLKIINLFLNALESLPREFFAGLVHLEELTLSNNCLTHLDDGIFESLRSLKFLYMNDNRLTQLSSNLLLGTSNLEILNIKTNRLRSIGPSAFSHHEKHLRNIDLSNNEIQLNTSDWENFYTMTKLNDVILSNNSIETLPSFVKRNPLKPKFTLSTLDLSRNKICAVHLENFYLMEAQLVDLMNNNIEMIYPSDDRYFKVNHIEKIEFSFNPVVCNATLIAFVKTLHDQENWITDMLRCAEPWPMRGRLIDDLKTTDLLAPLNTVQKDPAMNETADCPTHCNCWLQSITLTMLVNCSYSGSNRAGVPRLPDPRAFFLNNTELMVQHNRIETLPVIGTSDEYAYVTIINATHNHISAVVAANIPPRLRTIDLRHNRLQTLDASVIRTISRSAINGFWLANNPWRCDCTATDLLMYVQSNGSRRHAEYLEDARCVTDGRLLNEHWPAEMCPEQSMKWIMILGCVFSALSVAVLAVLFWKCGFLWRVWLLGHPWLRGGGAAADVELVPGGPFRYDAFVSYSHLDQQFVSNKLVPKLERRSPRYKLCLHQRDWLVGGYITESIAKSVEESRRTIIVLTENFVASDWARMEFRVAHRRALNDRRTRVIVIVCGDLQRIAVDSMDADLRAYLQTNTYIRNDDRLFWPKLRDAMSN